MAIKNIIFDLGGVLLNLDHRKTIEAFVQLGAEHVDDFYSRYNTNGLLDEFEVGKISVPEFRTRLQSRLKIQVKDTQFDAAWNAMLLDIPRARLELVTSLYSNYQVFLFSNTNEIHVLELAEICRRLDITELYNNCFHKKYYSCFLGERKPAPQAFRKVLSENALKAEETLFVDDFSSNILGAQAVGLHTLHLTDFNKLFAIPELLQKI